MQNKNIPEIRFQTTPQGVFFWHILLREGVDIEIQPGSSVQNLLHEELSIPQNTIREQIKTIFLNQKPVDDLQTPVPKHSTLTLSGAMPGFLGACMRINSPYAQMRDSISEPKDSHSNYNESNSTGIIKLKLFNVLVPEIGPMVLQKGILLSRQKFEDYLKKLPEDFWKSCHLIKVNGNSCPANTSTILERLIDSDYLQVVIQIA